MLDPWLHQSYYNDKVCHWMCTGRHFILHFTYLCPLYRSSSCYTSFYICFCLHYQKADGLVRMRTQLLADHLHEGRNKSLICKSHQVSYLNVFYNLCFNRRPRPSIYFVTLTKKRKLSKKEKGPSWKVVWEKFWRPFLVLVPTNYLRTFHAFH